MKGMTAGYCYSVRGYSAHPLCVVEKTCTRRVRAAARGHAKMHLRANLGSKLIGSGPSARAVISCISHANATHRVPRARS